MRKSMYAEVHEEMRPMLEMKKALGDCYTDSIAEGFIYTATVFGESDIKSIFMKYPQSFV